MVKKVDENDARQVIAVLEKILASNDSIKALCEKNKKIAQHLAKEDKLEKRTAQLIIMHYSNLCAAGGGASAIPGLIPGIGLIYSLLGTTALNSFLMLKFELEMSLALSHLAGFDIEDPRERKIAFLLACTALEDAYDEEKEPSIGTVLDLAINEYSTRELSKTLVKAVARVMMMFLAKRWTRLFPFVGIGIEASVNKVLSAQLGRECWRAIRRRRNAQDN